MFDYNLSVLIWCCYQVAERTGKKKPEQVSGRLYLLSYKKEQELVQEQANFHLPPNRNKQYIPKETDFHIRKLIGFNR